MSDRIVRGILGGQELLVVVGTGTIAARAARERHGLATSSAQLLGEALLAGAMLAALQKSEGTRVNLQVECDGPARGLLVDADPAGRVRGYVRAKAVRFGQGSGRFDARPLLGSSGYVSVLRDVGGTFYRGAVALERGELSRDLEAYFAQSEQVETALQLEVLGEDGDELGWVGGVMVQRMPAGDPAALEAVRARLHGGAFLAAVEAGARTPEALLEALFGPGALETSEERAVEYACPCSRERVLRALQTFGPGELFDMIHKDGKAEADCEFCGRHYEVSRDELQAILDLLDRADAEAEAAAQAAAPAGKPTLH
jgi:molecular chaperone Hsp33